MSSEIQPGLSECLHSISKQLSGKNVVHRKWEEKCEESECLSLRIAHTLEFSPFSSECDSKEGKELSHSLLMHVNQRLIDNGMGRGLHSGRFTWGGENIQIMGTFMGITNSGSHWIEPAECENCNVSGHMEGQLSGTIQYKNNERLNCYLTCSYALYFKPSKEFDMDGLKGTVEGVLGCEC
ncbi:MAG TPA: hypothetical protein VH500_13730 [Nitrososphaeraceae archaeon]|jgi:hypothetical protein